MVTMEQVRRAIDPEEPDYERAATDLGPDALPHLAELAQSRDAMTASKAVSLAGLIDSEQTAALLQEAAHADAAEVRVVTASAARHAGVESVLVDLMHDGDVGVRRAAIRAVPKPRAASTAIRSALENLADADPNPAVRRMARQAISVDNDTA
jgi:predicted TIM-barrel fold metal-dependent hydrolase